MPNATGSPGPSTGRDAVDRALRSRGFSRVGFAPITDDESPGTAELRRWIDRGLHADMEWIARSVEKRADPRLVLPGARTVVVASFPYAPPEPRSVDLPRAGEAVIAAYARGDDYHRVLERRLRESCRELSDAFPGEAFRYYVDTGPVLEKAWAQRAGLGWIAKNTCVISTEVGSYWFIAVVLTTLELPADPPATDHCGSCRLCIDACPTDALDEPYVLDARRCISYLTIESRGELDTTLEAPIGNLVFGCDICQEVCPWNRRPPEPVDPSLAPRPENLAPPLRELARLGEDSFRERFPRSAVRRAKRAGVLRNAIVALGNLGAEGIRDLEALERDPDVLADPVLAATLERALGRARRGSA